MVILDEPELFMYTGAALSRFVSRGHIVRLDYIPAEIIRSKSFRTIPRA